MRLEGKVAIITGANSGVGAATAKKFAENGCSVVIAARRTAPLEEIATEITANGGKALCVPCDISNAQQVKALVAKTVEVFGKVDILINNAGILDTNLNGIASFDDDDFDRVVSINTKGTMTCIREALPHMGEGSSIVNVDSVAGVVGNGGAVYVASKGAILSVTKHIAMTYAKGKIRCNSICPGTIITPMTMTMERDKLDPTVMGAIMAHNDLTLSPSTADDIANVALFLASDEARPITGQNIVCDFGVTL